VSQLIYIKKLILGCDLSGVAAIRQTLQRIAALRKI